MFCTKCGSQIPDGSQFCTKCGNPMDVQKKVVSNMVEMPERVAVTKPESAKESKRTKPPVDFKIVIGAILAIVVIAVAVVLINKGNSGDAENPAKSGSESTVENDTNKVYGKVVVKKDEKNILKMSAVTEQTSQTPVPQETSAAQPTETQPAETTAQAEEIVYEGMALVVKDLMTNNAEFLDFYTYGDLETTGKVNANNLIKVSDSRMSTWGEFKNYVNSLYASKRANVIITQENKYWGPNGDSGELYLYPDYPTGSDYDITWESFTVEITSESDSKCEFVVTDVATGHEAKGTIVKENGKWLLEKEVY